jgi:hypothetical protein
MTMLSATGPIRFTLADTMISAGDTAAFANSFLQSNGIVY